MLHQKWVVLAIFCMFSTNNGLSWLIFDSSATELSGSFPLLTPKSVELLSTWQPLVYIAAFYPLTRLQSAHDGLRRAVVVGAWCEIIGASFKVSATAIPHDALSTVLLNVGQIFSAVASPVAIGGPPALSALWFADAGQGTRATAAAVMANNLGNALGFGLVPTINRRVGFQGALWLEFGLALLLVVAVSAYFPSAPRTYEAAKGEAEMTSSTPTTVGAIGTNTSAPLALLRSVQSSAVFRSIAELLRNRSGVILVLCYAWSNGSYVAWTSLYDELIGGSEEVTSQFVGATNLAGMAGHIIGAMSVSTLVDLYWKDKMRVVIIVSCLAAAAFGGGMIGVVGFAESACAESSTSSSELCPNATASVKFAIVLLAVLTGAGTGAAAPIFYELLAELSHPIPESISGNVLSLAENIGALVMYQVVARCGSVTVINAAFVAGLCLCVLAMLLVRGRHIRQAWLADNDLADLEQSIMDSAASEAPPIIIKTSI